MSTRTRFEEEAKGNSEMAYFSLAVVTCMNISTVVLHYR